MANTCIFSRAYNQCGRNSGRSADPAWLHVRIYSGRFDARLGLRIATDNVGLSHLGGFHPPLPWDLKTPKRTLSLHNDFDQASVESLAPEVSADEQNHFENGPR